MAGCESCSGCHSGCGQSGSCGGCARSLSLSEEEIAFLRSLGEIPFQPIMRNPWEETPTYPGKGPEMTNILLLLEKKHLISLDYDMELKNWEDAQYRSAAIRGSLALTQRGQQVLELLDYQGAEEA